MLKWEEEAAEKAETLTKQLVDLTNAYGSGDAVAAGMLNGLAKSHRTLQQAFWRTMQIVMKKYPAGVGTDLRNEASVQFCKAVTEHVTPDHSLPLI